MMTKKIGVFVYAAVRVVSKNSADNEDYKDIAANHAARHSSPHGSMGA